MRSGVAALAVLQLNLERGGGVGVLGASVRMMRCGEWNDGGGGVQPVNCFEGRGAETSGGMAMSGGWVGRCGDEGLMRTMLLFMWIRQRWAAAAQRRFLDARGQADAARRTRDAAGAAAGGAL